MSRTTIIAATAAAVFAANVHDRAYYEEKFYNWKQEHAVQIQTGKDFLKALQNFANNDDLIETTNGQNLSYQLGHNQFSHMDVNEWREHVKLGLGYPSNPPAAYKNKAGSLVSLSEQNFVDCDTTDSGCNGGWMDNAFAWAKTNGGVCTESAYPYTAKKGTCNTSCGTKYAKPASYTDVTKNDVNSLMSALNKQPVSVAIEADQASFQLYKSGVLTASCGTNLDHGVLAVGYGTDNGVDYWTVKNSWGTGWGEAGYIRLARTSSQKQGQCGILSGPPSYPNL